MFVFNEKNQLVNGGAVAVTEKNLPVAPAKEPRLFKEFNEDLRAKLEEYRAKGALSNKQLGRMLGFDGTMVSKYINKKPEGDVIRFEHAIVDVLEAHERPRQLHKNVIKNGTTDRVLNALEAIRQLRKPGGITGPAGIGKTIGCEIFEVTNPTTVMMTASKFRSDRRSIENKIGKSVSMRGWDRSDRTRGEFLVDKFLDSGRLIIVDNAQRLTKAGLQFFFDFADEAHVGIAFVGNPEFLLKINQNDQMASRFGLFTEISFDSPEELVDHMLNLHFGKEGKQIRDLALRVIKQQGHARALDIQVTLAKLLQELAESRNKGGCGDLRRHFKAAHTKLVRNYKLED